MKTKNNFCIDKTFHGPFLRVNGEPVGYLSSYRGMNNKLALDIMRIKQEAEKIGVIRGRQEERNRLIEQLGLYES